MSGKSRPTKVKKPTIPPYQVKPIKVLIAQANTRNIFLDPTLHETLRYFCACARTDPHFSQPYTEVAVRDLVRVILNAVSNQQIDFQT